MPNRYYVCFEHRDRIFATRVTGRDEGGQRALSAASIHAGKLIETCTVAHWRAGEIIGRWTESTKRGVEPLGWHDMQIAAGRSRKMVPTREVNAYLRNLRERI
ncbi:MAG: hypothetical protein K2Z25_19310 [Beijerinckiaceae bacterium]|nr:hypothetical protein [Beijerinckiaceae bacterium]